MRSLIIQQLPFVIFVLLAPKHDLKLCNLGRDDRKTFQNKNASESFLPNCPKKAHWFSSRYSNPHSAAFCVSSYGLELLLCLLPAPPWSIVFLQMPRALQCACPVSIELYDRFRQKLCAVCYVMRRWYACMRVHVRPRTRARNANFGDSPKFGDSSALVDKMGTFKSSIASL